MADQTETFLPEPQKKAEPPAPAPSSAERTLGPYQLLFRIGNGGMAEVWVAVRRGGFGFKQHFAVKTIRPEYSARPSFRAMFLDEARLASRIHHSNVLPVLDLGEDHGVVYQAMPLVDGDSVAALVRERKHLPLEAALRIVIDAARGLHAAHEAKDDDGQPLHLVHRDVSPQNILVGVDGVAKVSDFGIAKAFGTASDETESQDVKGKRAYLAPEQLKKRPTDRRADVFALGIVAWELFAGRRCFPSGDAVMFFSLAPRIDDVRKHVPDVPAAIAEAVARAVAPDPDARFATSEAFADALEAAAAGSGKSPSAKQVGALVADALGGTVAERQRAITDETTRRDDPSIPITTDAAVVESVVPSRSRAVPLLVLGGAIVAAAAAVALWPRARVPVEASTPVVSATPPPPSPAPPPPPSVEPAPSAPPPVASSAPKPAVKAPPPKPRPGTAPQPKFSENPYAR